METGRIGSLNVSVAGPGCHNFGSRLDEGQTAAAVKAALDAAIMFFDRAGICGGSSNFSADERLAIGHGDAIPVELPTYAERLAPFARLLFWQ